MGSTAVPEARERCAAAAGRLGLLIAALAGVLGGGECALRAAGHEPLYRVYSKPDLFWRHDERLGWSLEPGARGRFVGPRPFPIEFDTRIEINSLGLRGPEIGAKQPDELRVVFLGDSAVAGFEVEQRETFSALLEERLAHELGPPVRVINAGVRGYGTDQSYLWYRERGTALGADLVALVFSANDFEDNLTLHRPRRPFGKPAFSLRGDGTLELVGVPVPRFALCSEWLLDAGAEPRRSDGPLDRLRCRAHMALAERSALFAWASTRLARVPGALDWLQGRVEPHAAPLLTASMAFAAGGAHTRRDLEAELAGALLRALAREVRASGARFLLLMLPEDASRIDLAPLVTAGVSARHVPARREIGAIRFRNDPHMNAAGHRYYAEGLVPIVSEPLLEIRRQRAGSR